MKVILEENHFGYCDYSLLLAGFMPVFKLFVRNTVPCSSMKIGKW